MFLPKKYYAELRYLRSVQKSFVPAKNITLWFTLCSKRSSRYFFLPKKTSIYAISRAEFFSCQKNAGFSAFQPLLRHATSLHVTCTTDKYCFYARKGVKNAKNEKCWKLDDLFSRAVLAYKFKRGASPSPTRAAPHYESEKIKKYLTLPLKKSMFLIIFYSCQKKNLKSRFFWYFFIPAKKKTSIFATSTASTSRHVTPRHV